MKLHKDISSVSQTVIDLQHLRTQLKDRKEAWKELEKAKELIDPIDKLIARLDTLEEKLHNPKAEVTYDILAKKGGAKLYSQLAPLYDAVKDSDGPVTQGMREVYAENAKELARLDAVWRALLAADVAALNEQARKVGQPAIVVPGGAAK